LGVRSITEGKVQTLQRDAEQKQQETDGGLAMLGRSPLLFRVIARLFRPKNSLSNNPTKKVSSK